jgi:uncharacterized protein
MLVRCPICEKLFAPEKSAAMPFCSERCRSIDLGRWFDERRGLPIEPKEDDVPREPAD